MAEPGRRRRRPAVSCFLCRKRKIRCNRDTPCSNCMRSKHETCVYEIHPSEPPRQHLSQTSQSRELRPSIPIDRIPSISRESTVLSHPSKSAETSSTSASTLATQPSIAEDVEFMRNRIRFLEEQLISKDTQSSTISPTSFPNSDTVTTTSPKVGTLGTFYVHHDTFLSKQHRVISRSITHKTRLFGQSHWINGIVMLFNVVEIIEPFIREESSKFFSRMRRCKSLARVIKARRAPPWPSPPTTDLPSKDVADELVDCYLRTTETVYRILHIPTFRRDYEALWISDIRPDAAFLIQLKLVLAIGAATYDERFSLRVSAVKWVYEAQNWISEPEFKSRLGIQYLQTSLLLLLARETTGIGELIWVSAGALLRTAMYMGLHRDPMQLPKRTTFVVEMRRRLWNTILEISLQSSMTSGGPPLISIDEFDTEPPCNFDDDQLIAEDSVPKPEGSFTQVSIAIALRRTFQLRLSIAKFLNGLGSGGTYEDTLRLDEELRASYKVLCRAIQESNSISGLSPSQFEIRAVDFIMNRYLSSLHVPFFGLALYETAYAYSRKVAVETSLKIWRTVCPSSIKAAPLGSDTGLLERDDFARFTICSSAFFRTVAIQASFVIAVELKTQLQEEESLGPIPLRPDLLSVIDEVKTWSWHCIEAGETNIKGYLMTYLIGAQIEGLMRNFKKDEFPRKLVKAAEDAQERCLPVLEAEAARNQTDQTVDGLDQMSLNVPSEQGENWDFMLSDAIFDFGGADPMNWAFNEGNTQDLPAW